MADASLADARAEISDGIAIEAMTPIKATTISSSRRVKPRALRSERDDCGVEQVWRVMATRFARGVLWNSRSPLHADARRGEARRVPRGSDGQFVAQRPGGHRHFVSAQRTDGGRRRR